MLSFLVIKWVIDLGCRNYLQQTTNKHSRIRWPFGFFFIKVVMLFIFFSILLGSVDSSRSPHVEVKLSGGRRFRLTKPLFVSSLRVNSYFS